MLVPEQVLKAISSKITRGGGRPWKRWASTTDSNPKYQSKQISNAFWKKLKEAVVEGNAVRAEELVYGLLDEAAEKRSHLDTRLFSLVLEAWNDNETSAAATRSQKLLEQMIELNEKGLLTEPPLLEDYHVVLNCVKDCENAALSENSPDNIQRLLGRLSADHTPTMETYELVMSIYAKGAHLDDAQQLLDVVVASDLTPSVELYNAVLACWANSPDGPNPAGAHSYLLQMIEEGLVKPNTKSFEIVIGCWTSAGVHGAANKAEALLDQMAGLQVKANSKAYKYTIQALAREGEAERAESWLARHVKDYMIQFDRELKPDLQAFQSVLTAYSRYHHPDAASKAESLLAHMKKLYESEMLDSKPNVWSYNKVMQMWVHARSPNAGERAMRLYELIGRDGLEPDTVSLNTLLQAYSRSNTAMETDALFRQKLEAVLEDPSRNPQPDAISFGTVLNAWAKSKSSEAPEKAENLLSLLWELNELGWEQCTPDVVAYTAAIQCWASAKTRQGPEKAEDLLRRMQELSNAGNTRLAPDSACWNSVISAWARAGDGDRAESLFKEMLADYVTGNKSPAPTVVTFTAVLSAWAKTKNSKDAPERAMSLLRNMQRLHQSGALDAKPNVVHYTAVLDCLAYSKSKWGAEQAEQLLHEMTTSDDWGVRPNVVSYNCVIKAWSLLRDEEALPRAMALFKELLEKAKEDSKLAPNRNTFGGVLKTLAYSNVDDKEKRAQAVVSRMQSFGIQLDGWMQHQLRQCKQQRHVPSSKKRPRKSAQRMLEQLPDIPAL